MPSGITRPAVLHEARCRRIAYSRVRPFPYQQRYKKGICLAGAAYDVPCLKCIFGLTYQVVYLSFAKPAPNIIIRLMPKLLKVHEYSCHLG